MNRKISSAEGHLASLIVSACRNQVIIPRAAVEQTEGMGANELRKVAKAVDDRFTNGPQAGLYDWQVVYVENGGYFLATRRSALRK